MKTERLDTEFAVYKVGKEYLEGIYLPEKFEQMEDYPIEPNLDEVLVRFEDGDSITLRDVLTENFENQFNYAPDDVMGLLALRVAFEPEACTEVEVRAIRNLLHLCDAPDANDISYSISTILETLEEMGACQDGKEDVARAMLHYGLKDITTVEDLDIVIPYFGGYCAAHKASNVAWVLETATINAADYMASRDEWDRDGFEPGMGWFHAHIDAVEPMQTLLYRHNIVGYRLYVRATLYHALGLTLKSTPGLDPMRLFCLYMEGKIEKTDLPSAVLS